MSSSTPAPGLALVPTLEEAGYVATERRLEGSRRRVRARLTPVGRTAFDGHVEALRAIVGVAATER